MPARGDTGRTLRSFDQGNALAPANLGKQCAGSRALLLELLVQQRQCWPCGVADRPTDVAHGVCGFALQSAKIAQFDVGGGQLGNAQRRIQHGLVEHVAGRRQQNALDHGNDHRVCITLTTAPAIALILVKGPEAPRMLPF